MAQEICSILIVEDDDDIRDTVADLLELEGHQVTSAANGREALAYLHGTSSLPDLILLDLMMPVMSGWEFRCKQRHDPRLASIPVVVLTGVDRATEAAAALQVSMILTKPIVIHSLLDVVAQHSCGHPA